MTRHLSAEQWADTLIDCGVRTSTADDWAQPFANVMRALHWSDARDLPNFLAQVLHESGMLQRLEEGLSYSAERLTQVWPRRFPTLSSAMPYARNPRALANRVYGGRMGNSAPDEGWRYRGRGLIQITGRDNYALAEQLTGMRLLDVPELLCEPEPALIASAAWWEHSVPDTALGDVRRVTRYVNGGDNGLAHRQQLTERAIEALQSWEPA